MKRINTPETRTYRDGDFIVEIVKTSRNGDAIFDCWLSADDVGIKEYMFGLLETQPDGTRYDWSLSEAVVEANLDEYEEDYRENHMDIKIIVN